MSAEQPVERGSSGFAWVAAAAGFVAAAFLLAWASGMVTRDGHWTVYTERCEGHWQQARCIGTKAAGETFDFRVDRAHGEVIVRRDDGSGAVRTDRLSICRIRDARNWTCGPGAARMDDEILQLDQGEPDAAWKERAGLHVIPKWEHWLLRGSTHGASHSTASG